MIRQIGQFFLFAALCWSCVSDQPPLNIPADGIDIEIGQRKRHEVSGYHGGLAIELDDITGGQVVVRLLHDSQILASKSLQEGEQIDFRINGESYFLRLDELINQLIGRDNAIFHLSKNSGNAANSVNSEIDAVLEKIRTAGVDYTFIRNGKEYNAERTADHLKMKWKNHGNVDSVEQFIEVIATKSSQSGEIYMVRHLNEEAIPLAEWLQSEITISQ